MKPAVRRVIPSPSIATTIAEAYTHARPPLADRPWVALNMIASLDGSVAVDGTSGPLGNATDRDVLLTLRAVADVVIVGAATARGEGYGPPSKPGQRVGVVTNSGSIDLTSPLFTSGAGFVIASSATPIDDSRADVLRAGHDRVDLAAALTTIDRLVPNVGVVVAEGGPTLNAALFAADLVDELDLSWSPHVVGGSGPRLTDTATSLDRGFSLAHLLVDGEDFVFTRWLRDRSPR